MSDDYLSDPRANTFEGWIAALAIFSKYHDKGMQGHLSTGSEHDILYLSDKPAPLSVDEDDDGEAVEEWAEETKADADMLNALGFHWDDEVDCWAKFT
jgi:hypothetical protein